MHFSSCTLPLLYASLPFSFSSVTHLSLSKPSNHPTLTTINMAKGGKLTKLKSAIKRWPSFTKLSRSSSSIAAAAGDDIVVDDDRRHTSEQLRVVYVGQSRRRYLVRSDIVEHPVFQELVDRSSPEDEDAGRGAVLVSCEVVLFEHLLWMLENDGAQLGSMDELVEYYTC